MTTHPVAICATFTPSDLALITAQAEARRMSPAELVQLLVLRALEQERVEVTDGAEMGATPANDPRQGCR